ncbi:MBL fold metallo-hydrolase [Kaistia sp. 32K]|uniref:MBL fold metallo-hydrolase n=1 Tax=Kaistia sp. 32K TaxID=2795690 RepID=UPI001916A5FE|nr:MBL fold metallo-hydrolase [Kaistia sp. 32K]BCP56339.1 MBL fold metallo-hydrolase [Kaistia sp. 32K]
MSNRLSILGSSGGFPVLGLPCSGYRLRAGGRDILIDCGPGVATALFAEQETCALDAVLISHMHPDHVLDLMPLAYALMTEWATAGRDVPMPLRVPEGGRAFLERFSDLFGHRHWRFGPAERGAGYALLRERGMNGEDWFFTVFDVQEFRPGDGWREGEGLTVSTAAADHAIPTAAFRFDFDGGAIAYTGDTRWRPELADLAADSRLLLADAHLSGPSAPGGAHMTPAEAARLAEAADVDALVLCHLGSPADGDSALAEARAVFGGRIHLAVREREYRL